MKITVYIINAILFMGCCLLVSTTTPDVKDIGVNNKTTYVNSDAIKEEKIVEQVEVVEVENIEPVTENKEEVEKIVKAKYEEPTEEKQEEESTEPVSSPDSSSSNNTVTTPPSSAGEIFTGKMSGYGADIGDYTASGYYIGNSITYYDGTYGEVRILAGGYEYPFGTIVKVSNSNAGSFIGIVLDRGPDIGKDKKFVFDLLFKTSSEAFSYSVSNNATFEIVRLGF